MNKKIAEVRLSSFVLEVSSMGVTGVRNEIKTDISSIVKSIKEVTDIPCAIGFGINNSKQARQMAEVADGVIVGSAIVKIIAKYGDNAHDELFNYVKEMKDAIK